MASLRIILYSIVAAIGYGICHDLVTAHLCVQYFTVAHPFIFPSDSPVVMALLWGVLATWWAGLILGTGLAIAARAGSRAKRSAPELLPDIIQLLKGMALFACTLGVVGFSCSQMHWIWLLPPLSERIYDQSLFFFDAFAHSGSYLAGFAGGIRLILKTWKGRLPLLPENAKAEHPLRVLS